MTPEVEALKAAIEEALPSFLPDRSPIAQELVDAMRYAVLGCGKRLRPMLTCAACAAFGGRVQAALAPACAVEFVHAGSLVHDDLPAMDDDALRRGAPSCHAVYGEAGAILAGNALYALAFETLAGADSAAPDARLAGVRILAEMCGWRGIQGGQSFDLASVGREMSVAELEALHGAKTGVAINAAVRLGALFAGAEADEMALADKFGARIGLAFQIIDDILDVTADAATLGKPAGSDERSGKCRFTALMGVDQAYARAEALVVQAQALLAETGLERTVLAQLGAMAVNRVR